MASFTPTRVTANEFNNGNEYIDENIAQGIAGDGVSAETVNKVIESQLYTQDLAEKVVSLATNTPDITYIADEGAPYVGINTLPNGSSQFVFKHLRGEKGDTGASGIGVATSSMFWLSVESNGDLYVEYNEGSTAPQFELDENKNLYYIIGE